jgi:TPR repeat protein
MPAAARLEADPRVVPAPTTSGTTEIDQWRGKCDSGDQTACNNLAFLIEQKQPDVAERLYEQACEHDVPSACHNLGVVVYQHGDLGRAVPVFVKACGLSHVAACETLRSMMNAQEKRTGNISCLEIAMKDGKVGHVCSKLSSSGDWDKLMEDLRKPQ